MDIMSLVLVCFASGLLSGAMGFGALIIMVPAFVFLFGINTAIPLGVLCGIATQATNVFIHRKHIQKDSLLRLLLGSLPGIWLGSRVLSTLPETWIRAALGTFIIMYVLWNFFGKLAPPTRPPAPVWAYAAGFLSGAFGSAFGVNGPPAVIYATRTGWSPGAIRAFLGVFSGLLFVITACTQYICGLIGPQVWGLYIWALPACILGNCCGQRITARLRVEQYRFYIFMLLLLMGVSLCWPAFHAFWIKASV